MIDKFFALFKNVATQKLAVISNVVDQSVRVIEQEFRDDPSTKDVAIDAVIDLLKKHKDSAVEVASAAATPEQAQA